MRPSSSPSDQPVSGGGLLGPVLARGGAATAVDDAALLQALLDAEAALAQALETAGVAPGGVGEAVKASCVAADFDPDELGAAAAESGNPVVPLVRLLTERVREAAGDEAAGWVHFGATSQDVLDTAWMLLARRALALVAEDTLRAANAAAAFAELHRETVIAGRTLGQQALPTTLGLKAAGWLHGLDEAVVQVCSTSADVPAQLGGAVGTLASLGDSGLDVLAAYASALDLAEPPLAWHTDRWPVIRIAQACGGAAAAASKIAGDVVLLSQTEVAEVVEGVDKRGGSSTLPHKRNPVAAVAARAAAMRVPGLLATLLAAAAQEHERAAGAWHAEWLPMRDLLTATGSAVAWLADCLEHLKGDPQRARENLDQTQGRLMAERITTVLQPHLGRLPAHNLVESVVRESAEQRRPFAEVLKSQPAVTKHLSSDEINNLLEPSTYLGSANAFIDRALKHHRNVR